MLLVRVSTCLCAIPVSWVVETMRPQPVQSVAGAPDYVLGLALVRGRPTPVIHLARLLTQAENARCQRYVLLRTTPRPVALAVSAVLGVEDLPGNFLQDLPPLLKNTSPEILAGIGTADQHLLLILRETRVLTPELEALFAAREADR